MDNVWFQEMSILPHRRDWKSWGWKGSQSRGVGVGGLRQNPFHGGGMDNLWKVLHNKNDLVKIIIPFTRLKLITSKNFKQNNFKQFLIQLSHNQCTVIKLIWMCNFKFSQKHTFVSLCTKGINFSVFFKIDYEQSLFFRRVRRAWSEIFFRRVRRAYSEKIMRGGRRRGKARSEKK